jgi:hypothetical protein
MAGWSVGLGEWRHKLMFSGEVSEVIFADIGGDGGG